MAAEKPSARERILDAFLALLDEKPYPEISITDIAGRAGVSRMAYYRNFPSKEKALDALFGRIGAQIRAALPDPSPDNLQDYLCQLFRQLAHWARLGRTVRDAHLGELILQHIYDSMRRRFLTDDASPAARYRQCFLSGAVFHVVLEWDVRGMHESPEDMAQLLCRLIPAEIWT